MGYDYNYNIYQYLSGTIAPLLRQILAAVEAIDNWGKPIFIVACIFFFVYVVFQFVNKRWLG